MSQRVCPCCHYRIADPDCGEGLCTECCDELEHRGSQAYLCNVVGCDNEPVGGRVEDAPFRDTTSGEESTIQVRLAWCAAHEPTLKGSSTP